MAWGWYEIATVADTLKNSVPDETIEVELENIGTETIRFIQGFSVGIIFRDYLLFPNMNNRNPFTKDDAVGAMILNGKYYVGINEA
jgi:hypothetical protein